MTSRNYLYLAYRKRLKLTYALKKHINTCTSHQVLFIHMYPKRDTLILGEDENVSENVGFHIDKELILEE